MLTLLATFAARIGIPERFHRFAAWAAVVVLAIALAALWLWQHDEKQRERGAQVQRETDLRETINRTEQGNAARNEIHEALNRDDGRSAAVYDQCMRTARTPANCQRYNVSK